MELQLSPNQVILRRDGPKIYRNSTILQIAKRLLNEWFGWERWSNRLVVRNGVIVNGRVALVTFIPGNTLRHEYNIAGWTELDIWWYDKHVQLEFYQRFPDSALAKTLIAKML